MGKKIVMLGILCGILTFIGCHFSTETPPTFANNEPGSMSTTYHEQFAYNQFVKQASSSINLMMPFYLADGGLSRTIQNCETYIQVENILGKKEQPLEEKTEEQEQPPAKEDGKQKRIALTFDDGPHQYVTEQILTTLQKHEVKATFFMLGQNVAKYPEIVKKADALGHEIASHTWSHKNLTKLSAKQMQAEINRANEAIYDAIEKYPASYRPPYGAIDEKVREAILLKPVLWNIDTLDWYHKTPAKTLANLKAQAKNNGIVLMHDIHQQSADALEDVILYLKEEGYEFVTTSELL
ncbi:polysaccharide deacetylase family protein [Solibacillus silvestris]|uniref:polysaccharide deacetylase family protein n=1 Tax=Solibacillus silvestris TaxID=76853 RepID=UPI003F800843